MNDVRNHYYRVSCDKCPKLGNAEFDKRPLAAKKRARQHSTRCKTHRVDVIDMTALQVIESYYHNERGNELLF